MQTFDFSKFVLYKWRYVIGYISIGLILIGSLVFAGLYLPEGLAKEEMRSVAISQSIDFSQPSTLAVPNLPFHLFQNFVLNIFGISNFTIKLPALIIAFVTAIGMVGLLRRWFRPSIAILASLIAVTTSQFLYIAQLGTPEILYIFWPIALLFLGTQVTRTKRLRLFWKILFSISAALSLYTPLGIYTLLAIALAVALHPHLRAILRRLSRVRLAGITVLFLTLIAPIFWLAVLNSSLVTYLLGGPFTWPVPLANNFMQIISSFALFWQQSVSAPITPIFGLGSVLIIGLGIYRIFRTRDTTRSYLLICWCVWIIAILLLNPVHTTIVYAPAILLLTAGLQSLITYWYRLFPRNPYARIAGLIPITILVIASIGMGASRYAYGYYYTPAVVQLFSKDLQLLPAETTSMQVGEQERAFWQAVAGYKQTINLTNTPNTEHYVLSRQAAIDANKIVDGYELKKIITSSLSSGADRWYVYQKVAE